MRIELVERNVVVVAHDVNMSIFQPWWIVENDILAKDEIIHQGVVFSPITIEIPTKNFRLTILPNRVQMSFSPDCEVPFSHIERVLVKIVSILPHTPYSALGFNFHYNVMSDSIDEYEKWDKKLFSCDYADLLKLSEDSKPRFGAYMSYDVLDGRLKSKFTPITIKRDHVVDGKKVLLTEEGVQFNYNFHYDVNPQEKSVDEILDKLKNWQSAQDLSQQSTENAVNNS